MPMETQQAIEWAISQMDDFYPPGLVDKTREYFNTHKVVYETFSYEDLIPYLPQ